MALDLAGSRVKCAELKDALKLESTAHKGTKKELKALQKDHAVATKKLAKLTPATPVATE